MQEEEEGAKDCVSARDFEVSLDLDCYTWRPKFSGQFFFHLKQFEVFIL